MIKNFYDNNKLTTAIYETFARMSQPFTNNIPEVDFHGANGNIILGGDAIAADRYCLTGDAKIITSYGTMPINQVCKYVIDDDDNLPEDFLIQDYKGNFVHADKIFDSGKHPVNTITLKNGQTISGTNNHPIVVLAGGGLAWKRIDQLNQFDKVAIPVFKPTVEINNEEGPLEAKMLGAMISEGCITTQNRIGVTNQDIALVEPVKDFFHQENVGVNASITYKESDKTYNFYTASKDYYPIFVEKYEYKNNAKDKIIPGLVFKQDPQYKSTFLRYLFEGDGSVVLNKNKKEYGIYYSTYSQQLAKDVQLLLLSLGVFCHIHSFNKNNEAIEYKISISGYDIVLFEKYINFVSNRKRNLLSKCVKMQHYKNGVSKNSYRYCSEISNIVQLKMPREKKNIGYGDLYSIWKAQPYLDDYSFSTLQILLTDYVFVPIKKIELQERQKVYSVRVLNPDSDHSYIANGIINHNTEARLAKITEDGMLKNINKQNVPMILNFSEDEEWPTVLPAIFPRLLVNGCQGIGVSLANVWLPHSFTETANLILNYLRTGELDEDNYYPDFPTGGTIINKDDLATINKTGKGKVILQAKYKINKQVITFYEMPYQVYIEPVIEKIKEVIDKGELVGISDVINKSDKKQIALVVECERGYKAEDIVEQLFNLTPLRSQYNANQNGIISKTPVLLNLREVVDAYVKHNTSCIQKSHEYDFGSASTRIEILEGLSKALASIDEIVVLIRNSDSAAKAKEELINRYKFTEAQAKAILDMKLAKLSKLDGVEIQNELEEKKKFAAFCQEVISSPEKQKEILVQELQELVDKYGDERRTEVIQKDVVKTAKKSAGAKKEEVIENVVITFNPVGYLQRIPLSAYRGNHLESFKITTADLVLLFTDQGRFFRVSPKDVKTCGIKDKGTAIGSIVKLNKDEKVISVFSSVVNEKRPYILFAMDNGQVKKTEKVEYISNTRNLNGMVATKLKDGSKVIAIQETNGNDIILKTKEGYVIRFAAEQIRASGKASLGVKGITLQNDDIVVEGHIIETKAKQDIVRQQRGGKGSKL